MVPPLKKETDLSSRAYRIRYKDGVFINHSQFYTTSGGHACYDRVFHILKVIILIGVDPLLAESVDRQSDVHFLRPSHGRRGEEQRVHIFVLQSKMEIDL